MSMQMSKTERSELRTLIRQRFKVLRADVRRREAELVAELTTRVNVKFADDDKRIADMWYLVEEKAKEANRAINDVLRAELGDRYPKEGEYAIVHVRQFTVPQRDRRVMLDEGARRITAQVQGALVELDRQETDLLTQLLVDALESDAARRFLERIPTVSALVPADRLLAIVGGIDGGAAR